MWTLTVSNSDFYNVTTEFLFLKTSNVWKQNKNLTYSALKYNILGKMMTTLFKN